jgi:hypothetical protein
MEGRIMRLAVAILVLLVSSTAVFSAETKNQKAIKLARCVADQLYLGENHTEPMVYLPAEKIAKDYYWCARKLYAGNEADLQKAASERAQELLKMSQKEGQIETLHVAFTSSEQCAEIAVPIIRESNLPASQRN